MNKVNNLISSFYIRECRKVRFRAEGPRCHLQEISAFVVRMRKEKKFSPKLFKISFCLLLFFCTFFTYAQTSSSIKGKVTDTEGKPIAFANVGLLSTGKGNPTNQDGTYLIENIKPGAYTLQVAFVGYKTQQRKIELKPGETLELNFVLEERATELQSVEVTGRQETRYDNDVSFAATKIASNIQDIPQAISYVTKEVMADRQAFRVNDVVKNISGVNQFSYYNDFSIRGFRAGGNGSLINGLRAVRLFGPQTLTSYLERVEVIKGPASAVFGNANPGGTMNRVTKKPLDTERKALSFTTGSFNTFRSTFDFTGPLNESKTLLYRLNLAYENSGDFRVLQGFKSTVIAPSVSFLPTPKTRLNFDMVLQSFDAKLDRGQPIFGATAGSSLSSTPISFAIGQTNDYHRNDANFATLSLSHQFSDNISFNASYMRYFWEEDLVEHRTSNRYAIDGNGKPIPHLMGMIVINRQRKYISDNLSSYFSIKANTGELEHRIVAGYDYIQQHQPQGSSSQGIAGGYLLKNGGISNPNFGRGKLNVDQFKKDAKGNFVPNVPHFNMKNPRYIVARLGEYVFTDRVWPSSKYFTYGVYVQDQIKIGKLQALLGLRHESYNDLVNYERPNEQKITQSKLLPRVGLVYTFIPAINLYGTYTESFQPQRAAQMNPRSGGPFDPLSAYMVEGGAKGVFFNKRLAVNLATYYIENNNILVNALDPNNPDLLRQRGQEQSRGIELDVNGSITPNFSLTANYAYNNAIISQSDKKSEIGRNKENAPLHSGGFFANYRFNSGALDGLNFNLGANFVTERNTFDKRLQLPSYTIVDMGASYKVNKVKLAFTLNNVFDKTHWVGGYSFVRLFPGTPRNYLLSVSYTF